MLVPVTNLNRVLRRHPAHERDAAGAAQRREITLGRWLTSVAGRPRARAPTPAARNACTAIVSDAAAVRADAVPVTVSPGGGGTEVSCCSMR